MCGAATSIQKCRRGDGTAMAANAHPTVHSVTAAAQAALLCVRPVLTLIRTRTTLIPAFPQLSIS